MKFVPIEQSDSSNLQILHDSVFNVSSDGATVYRCEACRQISNSKVVKPECPGITTLPESCKEFWGSNYVPVNFCHTLDGKILDSNAIELMLIGFAPGGATKANLPTDQLLDIHSVPLGLKWMNWDPASGAAQNRENIEYILEQISIGFGDSGRFRLGVNVHLTNLFKCRSYGTSVRPFVREAHLCYEKFLKHEILLLPRLKLIVLFMQKQNFGPLLLSTDIYGTYRQVNGMPLLAYMWHFSNPGFNNSRARGRYAEFCPQLGRLMRST